MAVDRVICKRMKETSRLAARQQSFDSHPDMIILIAFTKGACNVSIQYEWRDILPCWWYWLLWCAIITKAGKSLGIHKCALPFTNLKLANVRCKLRHGRKINPVNNLSLSLDSKNLAMICFCLVSWHVRQTNSFLLSVTNTRLRSSVCWCETHDSQQSVFGICVTECYWLLRPRKRRFPNIHWFGWLSSASLHSCICNSYKRGSPQTRRVKLNSYEYFSVMQIVDIDCRVGVRVTMPNAMPLSLCWGGMVATRGFAKLPRQASLSWLVL